MDNKAWAQGVAKKIKEKEIEVIKRSVNKVPYIAKNGVFDDLSETRRMVDQWFLGRYDVAVVSGNKRADL